MIFAAAVCAAPQTVESNRPLQPAGDGLANPARDYLARLASLAPVPCRDDFASMAQRHFNKTGRAAEIGVYRGAFSAKNLLHWQGEYHMIDAWAFRPGDPKDKNYASDKTNEANRKMAEHVTAFAGARARTIQARSIDAARQYPAGYFDWAYVDALHTREALTADLHAWWTALRPGGLLSGDDYGDMEETEYLTESRYNATYGNTHSRPSNEWGVIGAVRDFAAIHGVPVHVTWMHDCYHWPAWYLVKPEVPVV